MADRQLLVRFVTLTALALTLGATSAPEASRAPAFPEPAAMEHQVGFWTRIYVEIGTDAGFLHDDRLLSAVYETVKVSAHRRDEDGQLYGKTTPIAATGGGKVGWVPSDCLVPWRPDASMLGYYATGATAEDEPRLASRYDFTRPSFRRYLLCQHTFIPVAKRRFVLTRILENQHWTGILTGF